MSFSMLTTSLQFMWDMPNAFAMRGESVFTKAWFGIQSPLYFSVYLEDSAGGPFLVQTIDTDLQQVLDEINTKGRRRLRSLQLMSPPDVNGTKTWKLELIDRILLPIGAKLGDSLEIYEIGQKRYLSDLAAEARDRGEVVLYDGRQCRADTVFDDWRELF